MKKRKCVHHHIVNRCNGGPSCPENLLFVSEEREKLIHKLFGDRDFYEIIVFILRLSKAKHFERIDNRIKPFYKLAR